MRGAGREWSKWTRLGAACVASLSACSAHDRAPERGDAGVALLSGASISTMPALDDASVRVRALRAQFRLAQTVRARGPTAIDTTTAAIGDTSAITFTRAGDAFVPHFAPILDRGLTREAKLSIPATAARPFAVEDHATGLRITVQLRGASETAGEIAEGVVIHRHALRGADVVHRARFDGIEDYLAFDRKPEVEEARFAVTLPATIGLRLVEGTLELLDEGGAPRLRMAPPWSIDAKGVQRNARVRVEGCAYDTSPAMPWGRPITRAGSDHCEVVVEWGDGGATYPLLVDPAWTTTGGLVTPKGYPLYTALLTGKRVMVTGGSYATVDIYDRDSGTFAATSPVSAGVRKFARPIMLGTGKILLAGGQQVGAPSIFRSTAELYTPGTGLWAATGSMAAPRYVHATSLMSDGNVLVAGGQSGNTGSTILSTAEVYDAANGTFSATSGPLKYPRAYHASALLSTNRVLVFGGYEPVSGTLPAVAELYDPTTRTFSDSGVMSVGRSSFSWTKLADGRIYVAGGDNIATWTSAEIYDAATGVFTNTPNLLDSRDGHVSALLPNGRVLVVGGVGSARTSEIFDGTRHIRGAAPSTSFGLPTAAVLSTGEVLVVSDSGAALFKFHDVGASCTADTECGSGQCNERCCATSCQTECSTCAAGTGACTIIPNVEEGTCSGTKICDATGKCKLKTSQPCASNELCATGFCSDAVCCNVACGGSCDACNLVGSAGTCTPRPALDLGSPICGDHLCNGTAASCPTTCATDAQCGANAYCSAQSTCLPRKTPGASCNPATECRTAGCRVCTTGQCSDGVCCDSACGGACDVCTVALGALADGTCTFAPEGYGGAPSCGALACTGTSSACPATCLSDAQCASSRYCSAAGECVVRKTKGASCNTSAGVDCLKGGCRACANGACSDGVCCDSACDGACDVCKASLGASSDGTCTTAAVGSPGSPSCGAKVCDGAGAACPGKCAKDADCASGSFCLVASGECVSEQPNGASCTTATQCQSRSCVDSVCCDRACNAKCEACSAATKVSGVDGACGLAKAGLDPHSDCAGQDATSCGNDGTCDGAGACRKHAAGTTCGAGASCASSIKTPTRCDGLGACLEATGATDCAPFTCSGAACTTSCTTNADCASTAHCDGGACKAKAKLGGACASAAQCQSGFCVDGACCNSACTGQCEACDVAGGVGSCVPVAGAPHGARTTCTAGTASEPCKAASCDGTDRTTCAGLAGSSTTCRSSACVSGVATLAGACDGKGACDAARTRPCAPYACGDAACKASCATDEDCSTGNGCDKASGTCIAASRCEDDFTLVSPTGARTSCAPYRCGDLGCRTECASSSDCDTGYLCETSQCVKPTAPPPEEQGGCRHGRTGSGGYLVVLALGLLARRRAR